MSFSRLVSHIADDPAIERLVGRSTSVLALPEPARALAIAAISQASDRRPLLVALPTTAELDRMASDLAVYLGADNVLTFPAWETLPFERVSPSVETMGRRLETIWHLQDPERCPRVVLAPIRALIQRLSPQVELLEPITVGAGDVLDSGELAQALVDFGYRREPQVEHRGEFAVRGSIIDVFPSTADAPLRIDLWGDEVDRLSEFQVNSQRSTIDRAEALIFPSRELTPTDEVRKRAAELIAAEPWGREHWQRLADGDVFDGMESWLPWLSDETTLLPDLLQSDAMVVLVDPQRMRARAADLLAEETDLAASLARTWEASSDGPFPSLHLDFDRLLVHTRAPAVQLTTVPEGPDVAILAASGWEPPGDQLAARIQQLMAAGAIVVVAVDGAGSAHRVADMLRDWDLEPTVHETGQPGVFTPGLHLIVERLERGCVLVDSGVAVLAEADLTGRRRSHRPARPRKRQSEGYFDDLSPGDYVVHHQHGVGRFAGMVKRAMGGHERDYLMLDYKGDDKLYLPSDQIDLIRRYTGGDQPSLNRLGGSEFAKSKAKVRSAVAEIAQELVVLYQQRRSATGIAFEPDTPWQHEMESAFPYELTPDQATAVVDVKTDMESPTPMDRLVVGDVGFGKTEIAIRGVFKAVQSGYQVAVLVPTTLLAQQHFQTFSDRFAPYPVRVEVLSRFLTNAEARKIVKATAAGEVDVLIGTHRLLSQDVTFSKLGLLVVDEEQRFGVSHKESIKQFKSNVDVLTLTATPIPRTLEMSLTGIRDMSVLNTAPSGRQPILTYVGAYDQRPAAEAIRRELLREGQVFFVHNRVRSIDKVAHELRQLVPEARIAVAHGQMDEGTLEKVVLDFWEGEYDVLVCTTIIESGIDMPTVNTLVVDRAELLGLGQLHQLRGRVGRSGQRAYAYLFSQPDRVLTEQSYERLKTIGEANELGAGFQIAMRDLELRGAGNLLGTGQTGHVAAVGYDLYCQLVTEAVAELNGQELPAEPAEIKIDLPVAAALPEDYVPAQSQRLEAYRRLASVTDTAAIDDIRAEWLDRYGPIPPPAEALLEIAVLRAHSARVGVTEIATAKGPGFGGPELVARLGPVRLKTSQEIRFKRLFKDGHWKPKEYGDAGGQLQVGLMSKKKVAADLAVFFETMFPSQELPTDTITSPGRRRNG